LISAVGYNQKHQGPTKITFGMLSVTDILTG